VCVAEGRVERLAVVKCWGSIKTGRFIDQLIDSYVRVAPVHGLILS
jgi:hypothetical protein